MGSINHVRINQQLLGFGGGEFAMILAKERGGDVGMGFMNGAEGLFGMTGVSF